MYRDSEALEKLMALRSKPIKAYVDHQSLQIHIDDAAELAHLDGLFRFKNFYKFYQREAVSSVSSLSSAQVNSEIPRAESTYQTMEELHRKAEDSHRNITKMC